MDWFLVCGLGSLGQHCVVALAEFGVKVNAIELIIPPSWEIETLPELLDDLIVGDCLQDKTLIQAQILQCRAALIVTSNERVNIETALAIRQLNPDTRLVVRSAQSNLNELLSQQLGNFIAFDPTELPIAAFTLAALGTDILGYFTLDDQIFRVCHREIESGDRWLRRSIYELESHQRKILAHNRFDPVEDLTLEPPDSEVYLSVGDRLVYLETAAESYSPVNSLHSQPQRERKRRNSLHFKFNWKTLVNFFLNLNFRQQVRQLAIVYTIVLLILLFSGTILFYWRYPDIEPLSAFLSTAILLLGGYGDLFGEIEAVTPFPWWLKLFSLGLTLIGTAFVGVLYALLTEALLSSRFNLANKPLKIPHENHVIIFGMGRVGQKIASWLTRWQQPLVGITSNTDFFQQAATKIPLICGNLIQSLSLAHLERARSVVIVTDNDVYNLEAALMTRRIYPHLNLVVRTAGLRLRQHLHQLLPDARILDIHTLSAAAFAGAAFGENIISLFRWEKQTILVTEYQIEVEDTLHDLKLSDVAYGYGVVPVLYQKPSQASIVFPIEELILKSGDRLVVLATIAGLKSIELGELDLTLKNVRVRIESVVTPDAYFEGANLIYRIAGCDLSIARQTMAELPQTLPCLLYRDCAHRLVRELRKALVIARIL
ncbi:TrkA family potassium uptake protein [Myxosarcina sp. GI1]|uniref:potassium channel family protein n=1 Tax=Myxosarcina sp. GI1 TaxID=1541065 RepID=UPI000A81F7B2|nr:NAD-binding protein [Myxosarcina sp. GI1]